MYFFVGFYKYSWLTLKCKIYWRILNPYKYIIRIEVKIDLAIFDGSNIKKNSVSNQFMVFDR